MRKIAEAITEAVARGDAQNDENVVLRAVVDAIRAHRPTTHSIPGSTQHGFWPLERTCRQPLDRRKNVVVLLRHCCLLAKLAGEQTMDEGLSIVLSPTQLAAILSGQAITEGEMVTNRLWGGLKVVGGSLEMVGAAALLLAPEPTMATKVGGAVLSVHGSDTMSTGFWEIWTGRPRRTLTDHAATALARRLGASPDTAAGIGAKVDMAVPIVVSIGLGAVRIAAVRFGRISLAEHEAAAGSRVGGHTIAKHVAKTEAELRARLAAEARRSVVSSFASLEVAERTLYRPSAPTERPSRTGPGSLHPGQGRSSTMLPRISSGTASSGHRASWFG
jgi:hypothetical protein